MKGKINFFCTFALVLLLVGCGTKSNNKVNGNKQSEKSKSSATIKKMSREDFKKMTPEQRKKMRESFMKNRKDKPILVETIPITKGDLNNFLVLNGTVEPERMVKVYSRLAAFVEKKLHDEGDYVKKGETLCTLDKTEITILFQQAKIQLQQSKLDFKNEERNYKRNKDLSKNKLISVEELQAAEAAFTKAKLNQENKQEDFKNLQLQLGYTNVTSPVDGYITARLVEIGDRVNSNQHIYTVEDFDPLLVVVYVPSADAIDLKKGMSANVVSEIIPNTVFHGKIKIINPRIDINSGTVKVVVEVKDGNHKLKPGMFVETRIVKGKKENIIVIPRKSISFKQGKNYVFVNKKGIVEQRTIETGLSEDDRIEITHGLSAGESLVVVGIENLKDKSKIRIRK